MDGLSAVYALAVQIKEVYDGVQGNKEQCKMLHDQVQHVAASLKALPDPTKRKKEVKAAVSSLRETLRSCLDLIGEFKKTHWIKKAVFHASTTGKFEALFVELDRVLQVCGFALEVSQAQRSEAARKDDEKMQQLLEGNAAALDEIKAQNNGSADQQTAMMELLRKMQASLAAAPPLPPPAAAGAVDKWHIAPKAITFEKEEDDDGDMVKIKLGAGSFGVVYKGKCKHADVAVKQMDIEAPADVAAFKKEVSLMFDLHHPHIVVCFGGTVLKKAVRIVTELMTTSLGKEIHVKKTTFSEPGRRLVVAHVARGLSYLHAVHVTHRDLKPDNVMRDQYGVWKLIDFGMASTKSSSQKSTKKTGSNQGTQGYMAPELYTERGGNHKVDAYAFGVAIWELYAQVSPFLGVGDLAIGDMVKAGKRPSLSGMKQPFPPDVQGLVEACWHHDPQQRPEMANVVGAIEAGGDDGGGRHGGDAGGGAAPAPKVADLTNPFGEPPAALDATNPFSSPSQVSVRKPLSPPQPHLQKQLCAAVEAGDVAAVRTLLAEEGADPTVAADDEPVRLPMYFAAKGGHVNVVSLLLEHNADIHQARTDCGATPVWMAAQEGHVDVVTALVAGNADVNQAKTTDGATPVYVAAANGHVDVVTALVASNADVNQARTDSGATPVFVAAANGHVDVVTALVAGNADVNQAKTTNGCTPVFIAAQNGHIDVVKALVAGNADVNQARTDTGGTPVLIAAQNGHVDVVTALVASNADVNQATKKGTTPLKKATQKGHTAIAALLKQHGAV